MTSIKTIAIVAALTALGATASEAFDPASGLTMKPLHGISFDIGVERAASYFESDNGRCKLVVTLAGEIDWDRPADFAPTRFETEVAPGKSSRYTSTSGKTIEFACALGAAAMSVHNVEQIAAGKAK